MIETAQERMSPQDCGDIPVVEEGETVPSQRYLELQELSKSPDPDVSEPAKADLFREFGVQ